MKLFELVLLLKQKKSDKCFLNQPDLFSFVPKSDPLDLNYLPNLPVLPPLMHALIFGSFAN